MVEARADTSTSALPPPKNLQMLQNLRLPPSVQLPLSSQAGLYIIFGCNISEHIMDIFTLAEKDEKDQKDP